MSFGAREKAKVSRNEVKYRMTSNAVGQFQSLIKFCVNKVWKEDLNPMK